MPLVGVSVVFVCRKIKHCALNKENFVSFKQQIIGEKGKAAELCGIIIRIRKRNAHALIETL
jgi:hypothetical protein